MRIAVLLRDRCQPKKCAHECIKYCPRVRMGEETIIVGEKGRPIISETLCAGCGICVHKCPFEAIKIINLPEELETDKVHQYGKNGFRLYRLPTPRAGEVIGILGPNGIGKTTTISILAGLEIPNLGEYDSKPNWDKVLSRFSGTELYNYLEKLSKGQIKTSMKPQYVDKLPKVHKGKVKELLEKSGQPDKIKELITELELEKTLDRNIDELSGGELQRVAIAASMAKDADIYFFDEPSSYLDIYQRLKVAKIIQKLSEGTGKMVIVIEHDLAVLDFLASTVHLMYGSEGAYGVVVQPRPVRNAINTYLSGFMKEENIRFRDWQITFESHPPREEWETEELISFDALEKKFEKFHLRTSAGLVHKGETVGVVGPNGIGKTTFVKMLAGVLEPTKGKVHAKVKVSYKPQYIKPEFEGTVKELFFTKLGDMFEHPFFKSEIERPLGIKTLYEKDVNTLSGGELQRVSLALALSAQADMYLIDEPSAYLDSNQRMEAAKTIRRVMEKSGRSALIVDHDMYFIDLVSDSIMVFHGEPAVYGIGEGPFDMREGMNKFLKEVGITFRRDPDTNRPRINKVGSVKDREQKESGEYYYTGS
ncbi:MAG: ribosome biogenesis/translation initiation ATPase RLI [Thermoplasmata archaeon]